jgi:hypothetical protein
MVPGVPPLAIPGQPLRPRRSNPAGSFHLVKAPTNFKPAHGDSARNAVAALPGVGRQGQGRPVVGFLSEAIT